MRTEKQLLAGAKAYDHEVLTEIYDRYNAELYRYAMRKLGNPDLAEECISETFSRFLQALQRNKGPKTHLRAYLYRIAHNWIANYYERRPPHETDIDDVHIGKDPEMLDGLDKKSKQDQIRAALNELTPDQQQVILLKYYEGWSNREVAAVIEKPVGSVKSLQHRALGALRRLLTPSENQNS